MRPALSLLIVGVALLVGGGGCATWQHKPSLATASAEVSSLTPDRRGSLERLRDERKFQPYDFPSREYTGAESPEDEAVATRAVNSVIETILARQNGTLPAGAVSKLIDRQMRTVRLLATEDRERTQDYMLEIWYLIGFRSPTGLFAYGQSFEIPQGHGEPLPPGWKSPTEPRPIPN